MQDLTRLLARAIVAQARRQAQQSSDPGSETTEAAGASNPPAERKEDAV